MDTTKRTVREMRKERCDKLREEIRNINSQPRAVLEMADKGLVDLRDVPKPDKVTRTRNKIVSAHVPALVPEPVLEPLPEKPIPEKPVLPKFKMPKGKLTLNLK